MIKKIIGGFFIFIGIITCLIGYNETKATFFEKTVETTASIASSVEGSQDVINEVHTAQIKRGIPYFLAGIVFLVLGACNFSVKNSSPKKETTSTSYNIKNKTNEIDKNQNSKYYKYEDEIYELRKKRDLLSKPTESFCPMCKEKINIDALKCKECSEVFDKEQLQELQAPLIEFKKQDSSLLSRIVELDEVLKKVKAQENS